MKAKELGKRVVQHLTDNAEDILLAVLVGGIAAGAGYAGYRYGLSHGISDAAFYTQAAILGDVDSFLELADIGISKYTGKHLEKLNAEARRFAMMAPKYLNENK